MRARRSHAAPKRPVIGIYICVRAGPIETPTVWMGAGPMYPLPVSSLVSNPRICLIRRPSEAAAPRPSKGFLEPLWNLSSTSRCPGPLGGQFEGPS